MENAKTQDVVSRAPRGGIVIRDYKRFLLWKLGVQAHHRSLKRTALPTQLDSYRGCIAVRALKTIVPWSISEYPGLLRFGAGLLGLKEQTVKTYIYTPRALPITHAATLAASLRDRAAAMTAMAEELDRYIEDIRASGRPTGRGGRRGATLHRAETAHDGLL